MTGIGEGSGAAAVQKFENHMNIIKYTMLFTNAFEVILGVCILIVCFWLRFEDGVYEWLDKLNALSFYVGVYILIFAALVIIGVAIFGCITAMAENQFFLLLYIAIQILAFLVGLIGATVLLGNSARDSNFQPMVRESMRNLIMHANYEPARQSLQIIQETIGCCGADGARDYLNLQQPLPNECRDTVTGNPFFHGCVAELTWFFESKCNWAAGIVLTVCLFHVINIVFSIIFIQGMKKEQRSYY
ncbi:tetraspanin-2A [Coccinella septempunctata]|uniref:tetraspanin-2A n=1 Tax=Coccinella septempunctata TaxID=41139 RepID=UPI001D095C44|nr:tetraspanin-2A [Coccinella septempunctata]